MIDRNVEFPNRFRMTKVEGTDDIYDLIPAPGEVIAPGDTFSKANMLPDSIPALLGLKMVNPQVKDALNVLANVGNLHVWERVQTNQVAWYNLSDVKTNGTLVNGDLGYARVGLSYGSSVSVSSDGYVTIENNTNNQFYATQSSDWPSLSGKFIQITDYAGNSSGSPSYANSDFQIGTVFYIPPGGNIAHNGSGRIYLTKYQIVTGHPAETITDYLTSTDPNAYPKQSAVGGEDAYYTLGDVVVKQMAMSSLEATTKAISWAYADSISVAEDGTISLQSPRSRTIQGNESYFVDYAKEFIGKFAICYSDGSSFTKSACYFFPSDATVINNSTEFGGMPTVQMSKYQSVTGHAAIPANTTITYLGQLGGGARIEVGSYVGTGTYGSGNPNTLTFEFEPKLIVITEKGYGVNPLGSQWNDSVILVQGSYSMYVQTSKLCKFNVAGKNATWYTEGSAGFQQLNSSGTTYNYIAIG